MEQQKTIQALNELLEHEHACAIRYSTHAAVISGPYAEEVAARLKEIAHDELEHAEKLRQRIVALGGVPSMEVSHADLTFGKTLEEILAINIAEENDAIALYRKLFREIPPENAILYETIQDIIMDEQEHLEELENFLPDRK